MKVVRMFAALLVFSSALHAAPSSSGNHGSSSTATKAAATAATTTGPTSGTVIVNAGGAVQDPSDTVPAGSIGTIVAGPKTVNGIVYVNVLWSAESAAFQNNYNGWTPINSLSAYTGTGTTPTNPPPTKQPLRNCSRGRVQQHSQPQRILKGSQSRGRIAMAIRRGR